jgi:site-specific DNA recombinase
MEPELGVSGGLPVEGRPSLRRAVEGVEQGEYSGIVVAYLSRLGRNLPEQLRVWDRVQAAGGQIVTIREGIDTSTASGRLHRNLLLSIDTHEREQHAERFEERRRAATESGIWQRRQTPRGYRRDPGTRRLVPSRHAGSVEKAFREYLQGATIAEVSRRLGMTPSGARQLLRNRVYLGELRVGRHLNPAAHPPLIDHETFEAARHKLDAGVRPPRSKSGPALLAGLVRCASCGHLMTRTRSRGEFTYACPSQHSEKRCPAPPAVMARRLDSFVEPVALGELRRLTVRSHAGNRVAQARARLERAERELEAYLVAVTAADVGPTAFAAGARERRKAVDDAEAALRDEQGRQPALPAAATGADFWADLDAHERNALLRSLLAAVVVRPVGRGHVVPIAERARILAYGTSVPLPKRRGGEAGGIVPIPFPDADNPGVLGMSAIENPSQSSGRLV